MAEKKITRKELAAIGGLVCKRRVPQVIGVKRFLELKDAGLWPGFMEDMNPPLYGQKVYEKSARECAEKLGTTPRQISKLRNHCIDEAKPLSWYKEHKALTGDR